MSILCWMFLGPRVYGVYRIVVWCVQGWAGRGKMDEKLGESVQCGLGFPKQGIMTKTHGTFIWRCL